MKKSHLLGAVCAILFAITTLSANAAILKFEFSGETDEYFGPVVSVSGSFLFDTSIPPDVFYTITSTRDGISYVGQVEVWGAISDFHIEIEGNGSIDSIEYSQLWMECVPYSYCEAAISTDVFGIDNRSFSAYNGYGYITTEEWFASPDPLADLFFARPGQNISASFYLNGFGWGGSRFLIMQSPSPHPSGSSALACWDWLG